MRAIVCNYLFMFSWLIIFAICSAGEKISTSKSKGSSLSTGKSVQRTFISEIIGFSALKFLLILGVPLIFSIFIGAMLVFLFPFPLITSTAGLAGAAAVGRRQGREAEDDNFNNLDEFDEILEYLGIKESLKHKKVKHKNFKPAAERCAERFACEVGKTSSPDLRGAVYQMINEIPRRNKHNWKSVIQAYLQGSQTGVNQGPNFCPKYKCHL